MNRSLAALVAAWLCYMIAASGTTAGGSHDRLRDSGIVRPLGSVEHVTLSPVDDEALRAEDAVLLGRAGVARRVGLPRETDLFPSDHGSWDPLPDGSRLWRLRVTSPGARWIVLGFGTFRLQPGGRLFVSDGEGRRRLGPFTDDDVREHGQLWTPPLVGDSALLELHWPAGLASERPNLHLGTISHGYEPLVGFGLDASVTPETMPVTASSSGACNVDVNCPSGDDWQDEKRGVVRLLSGGSSFCTGTLVHNTAGDCAPLVLTARHCLASQTAAAGTTIELHYERPQCESGAPGPTVTLSGATLRASYAASDFSLIEMDHPFPTGSDAYLNGWSRATQPPARTWGLHHPSCDVMKISRNEDPLIDGLAWGADHWRVTEWEEGTTEPCSSGSPLFDAGGRIVGQLHGGAASCSNPSYDEYGKFDVSWNGAGTAASRLRDWLDPTGSGALALDGIDLESCRTPRADLRYAAHSLTEIVGNDDGVSDPGESLRLEIEIVNAGRLDAHDVVGTLSTDSPGVVVADPSADWGLVPAGGDARSDGDSFRLHIDPGFVCGDPIALRLESFVAGEATPQTSAFVVPTGHEETQLSFADDVESATPGWSSQPLTGTGEWSRVAIGIAGTNHGWFIADAIGRRDIALRMPTLPALAPRSILRFRHRFDTEANRDGGVLELSTDGGANWIDGGSRLLVGGYSGSIPQAVDSALAGRAAWSGDSGGWTTVEVDLSSFAGEDLQVRWRFATNRFVGDLGWLLDDVTVEGIEPVCRILAAPPGEVSAPGQAPPLTIGRADPEGYELTWSAPVEGGAPLEYRLYRGSLASPSEPPACSGIAGPATRALLDSIEGDATLLIVAANSLGEGPSGRTSAGLPRPQLPSEPICP